MPEGMATGTKPCVVTVRGSRDSHAAGPIDAVQSTPYARGVVEELAEALHNIEGPR
jgi:hypothetical protein